MYKKALLLPFLLGLVAITIASCDKDFNEIGTDIVGDDHFGFEIDTNSTVKAYNQKLGPIASNNLPINPLGFYHNPAFGDSQANFVTQLELTSTDPTFNNTDPTLYVNLPSIDSVILDIPYFKKLKSVSGKKSTYTLDSIYGPKVGSNESKFGLEIYQSNYFLRNLDPNSSLGESQSFYTDDKSTIESYLIPGKLNNAPVSGNNSDEHENSKFYFDKREHALITVGTDGVNDTLRSVPSMRLHLDNAFFYNKILNAPSGALDSQISFKNYFRGLYFKVIPGSPGPGNMAMLNFKGGKITIYYKEDKIIKDNPDTPANEYEVQRLSKTYGLNLAGNTISLLEYTNENPDYITAANSTSEASKIYLKGGQGSMAIIDLFGNIDTKSCIENPSYNEGLPISVTNPKFLLTNTPNGISDELDNIKFNGWLINEANLTFYIDKDAMKSNDATDYKKVVEPNRILLYDLTHKKAIVDYLYDISSNNAYPKLNKLTFGGYIADKNGILVNQKKNDDGEISVKGTKYKVRITNYLRNLIKNDSTNVRLGLSVTENINNLELSKLKTPNSNTKYAPTMSVLSQLGTILYGSNIPVTDEKYKYRLKLEIYYTKPNQD